jgi:hypothetical protein
VGDVQNALAKATKVAVHGKAVGFLPLAKQACDQEGVKFIVAATEVDAQLPYLFREHKQHTFGVTNGQDPVAIVNDADYAVNQGGVEHAFFLDEGGFKPTLRYLAKSAFGESPHHATSNSAGSNQAKYSPIADILIPLIDKYGHVVVRAWATMTNNDYNAGLLPGFGGKRAAMVLKTVLEKGVGCADDDECCVTSILAAAAPLILALFKDPKEYDAKVRRELAGVFNTVCPTLVGTTHSAVHIVLELAHLMYNCMAVFDPVAKKVTHAIPVERLKLKTISKEDARTLCGVTTFKEFTESTYNDWNECKLDLRTLKPWGEAGDDGIVHWHADRLPGETASSVTPLTHVPGSDHVVGYGDSVVQEAEDDTPPPDIRDWTIYRCKEWLKARPDQGTLPTKKADLQELIIQMHELGLTNMSREDVEDISRKRFQRDTAEWLKVRTTRLKGVTVDLEDGNGSADVGTLAPTDGEFVFKDNGADTQRNRQLGQTRHVMQLQRSVGKEFETEFGIRARTVHVTAIVGFSYPGTDPEALSVERRAAMDELGHGGRVTSVSGLVVGTDSAGRGGHWIGSPSVFCLVPQDMLDRDSEMVKSKRGYRPCRERYCVHCRATINAICDCAPRGVDGENQWKKSKATNRSLDRTSFADTLPVVGHDDYGSGTTKTKKRPLASDETFDVDGETWKRVPGTAGVNDGQDYWYVPGDKAKRVRWDTPLPTKATLQRSTRSQAVTIPKSKLAEIDKGCHDQGSIYHQKLMKLLKLKKSKAKAIKKESKRAKMSNRKFKVETVLHRASNCTCTWSPSRGVWMSACAACRQYTAVYLYDRGLNRTSAFRRTKTRCLIPARKSKGQVAFSEAAGAGDRSIARERIHIERNNVELRTFSGFDSQISVSAIALAGAEGSVARGKTNMQMKLHDWVERSHGIVTLDLKKKGDNM